MTLLTLLACQPDYELVELGALPVIDLTDPSESVPPGEVTVTFTLANDTLNETGGAVPLEVVIWQDDDVVGGGLMEPGEHELVVTLEPGHYVFRGVATEASGTEEQSSEQDVLLVEVCQEQAWYLDADGDGFGAEGSSSCQKEEGYVSIGGDCDDSDDSIHPDAQEVCDGVDQDCDGQVDEDAVDMIEGFVDSDGDGYGDTFVASCDPVSGLVDEDGDCDDEDPAIHPGAEDICDGVDNDCDGQDGTGGLNVPGSYATIGEAVDAAEDGDMVCVSPGTYTERFSFDDKDILVIGSGGSEVTFVDGQQNGTIVTFEGEESDDALLQGFTLLNGAAPMGGGVHVREGASPTIRDVAVVDAECPGLAVCRGAGIALEKSGAVLIDVRVTGSRSWASETVEGGGMYVDGGNVELLRVTVSDNSVENTGSGKNAFGGGLYVEGDLSGTNVILTGNTVSSDWTAAGGGAHVEQGELELTNAIVAQNEVEGRYLATGAGLSLGTHGELVLENVDIVQNLAVSNTYAQGAGLAWVWLAGGAGDISFDLMNTSIYDNDLVGVYETGHGMFCYGGQSALSAEHVNWYGQDQNLNYDCSAMKTACVACIEEDPLYADAEALDMTLQSGSPLINAGSFDLSDADGSRSDIGAYGGPDGASW